MPATGTRRATPCRRPSSKARVARWCSHGDTATEVEWLKPSLEEGITFSTKDGKPFTIAPGKVFFELAPDGDGRVTLG